MAGRELRVHKWPEVWHINGYAALFGCMAMTIRGLGFLVVTWATVVLLGGFISTLGKKDFWSLTVITFIQLAGVVDNFAVGKWSSIQMSLGGLHVVTIIFVEEWLASTSSSGIIVRVLVLVKQLLAWITFLVQSAVAFVVIPCCRFGIYRWGMYIAAGVSLWRLQQHDYGNTDGDSSKANMNQALDVLYIIVLVQGAVLVYTRILDGPIQKGAVAEVAEVYGFEGPSVALVQHYTWKLKSGCSKNPSFARGRNLVTYAVDLISPDKTPQEYLSGLKILSTILGPFRLGKSKKFKEQCTLMRQLILYAPSSHIFGHMLVLSNKRNCPYGIQMHLLNEKEKGEQREMRKHAASIVAHMADGASPKHLPQVIQCMSSLIHTFEEHQNFFSSNSTGHDSDYAKEEKDYLDQLGEGLHVLYVLAADENNCRLIINTPGLLTKIMTPLASNLYHQTDHDTWETVLEESLKVMNRLTATYGHGEGETGAKLVREIETNLEVEAVETMMRILRCDICSQKMGTLAMGILTNLHAQMQTADKEYLIEMLVHIYTTANSRTSALEALATLCFQDGSNATIILQVNGSAVSSFTNDLKALSDGCHGYHISVAEILQHACLHYTRDDECLRILKESMTDVIPKVLNKILTAEATKTGQQGDALQTNGQSRSCSSSSSSSSSSLKEVPEEHDIREIETALLSLCVTVHETFISADQYLALQFDGAIGELSLPVKLREMVERNSEPTASCLKILKLTSRMVISIMKCRGSRYPKADLESLVEALLKACSRNMYFIDRSMDFARGDNAAKPRKPGRILASFVTEAMELVRDYAEPDAMSSSTIVGGELPSN